MFKYGAARAKGMGDNRLVLHGMWIVGMEIGLFVFGGDIVRAYLSDYAIEKAPSGGAATTMAISNIGPLQSADTVAIIAMNGTAAVLESRCPEGRAEAVGAYVVAVSFDYMTPGVQCEIDVASDAAPPRLTQFTARGMPEVEVVEGWGRTYGGLNLAVFAMIAGQVVIAAFLVRAKLPALRDMYWPSRNPGTGRAGMRTPLPNTSGWSTASGSATRGPVLSSRLPAATATARPSGSRPPCPCRRRASGRCCVACATTALSTTTTAWIRR